MRKFKYIIELEYKTKIPTDWLNKRGNDGWELISVIPDVDSDGTELLRYYFKKQVVPN